MLVPTRDGLNSKGLVAYHEGNHAMAVVLWEAAAARNKNHQDASKWLLINRMNSAAAMRDLGALERARDELDKVRSDMQRDGGTPAPSLGRCSYHLAQCEFRLNRPDKAKVATADSLRIYKQAPEDSPVPSSFVEESQKLLTALEAGERPPPKKTIDLEAELQQARARLEAVEALAGLQLDERCVPLLERVLGSARSTGEVLSELDQKHNGGGRPPVFSLSLKKPITPHLEELLGPSTLNSRQSTVGHDANRNHI